MALYGNSTAPKTELLINGTWTDVSSYVRRDAAIDISRGRQNEQSRTTAQTCNLTLNQRDGRFSNRNPGSPYYGLLPRSTQMRVSAGSGDNWAKLPLDYSTTDTTRISTPDLAALDITSDIEIRADIWPRSWRPEHDYVIASKYLQTGEQRSWALMLTSAGTLTLFWSSAGTVATRIFSTSTAAIPATSGRLSIKVTLDVDNGAAGNSAQFFTASSIDGTYTQLGSTVTNAGTTSIFSSSARLVAGAGDDVPGIISGETSFRGRLYKLRVYNGIAGSVVANPDFTAQSIGATSFTDSATRVWTLDGRSRLTSDRLRFWGELTALPQQWDKPGVDYWVPVTASGVLRRLSQGNADTLSPLYRVFSLRDLTGWLPLEDGSDATEVASAITGAPQSQAISMNFASDTSLPGAKQAAAFTSASSKLIFRPRRDRGATGTQYFTFYFKLSSLPASNATLVTITTTGTAKKITIGISPTQFKFDFYDLDTAVLSSLASAFGTGMTPTGQWMALNLLLETSGGNVSWSARWSNVMGESFVGIGPTTFAGSVGQMTQINFEASGSTTYNDLILSHVHATDSDLDFVDAGLATAANGFAGEDALARISRLAGELGVDIEIDGDPTTAQTMGAQSFSPPLDLLYECVDADGGILAEARDANALTYRARTELEHNLNLELSYDLSHLSETPTIPDDDQGVANDVTVSRPGGSSARREITTGSMSVNDPPDGIGRFVQPKTVNAYLDADLYDIASWIANLGSYDGPRIPNLSIGMHRTVIVSNATLSSQIYGFEIGDSVNLIDLPVSISYDDVLLLNQGYREQLNKETWTIVFNTTPAEPYNTGRYNSTSTTYNTELGTARWGSGSTILIGSLSTTGTSVKIGSEINEAWSTTATGYNVAIAGEVCTVTAMGATTRDATLSANGFEAGTSGWDASNCVLTQSSTFANTGTFSGLLTTSGSPSLTTIRKAQTSSPRVFPNHSYSLSGYFRTVASLTARLTIDWYDENWVFISKNDTDGVVAAGAWVNRIVTATAPSNAAYARYGCGLISSPPAGSLLYADDLVLSSSEITFQTVTLTRSVNGVVKAQTPGTQFSLARPTRWRRST